MCRYLLLVAGLAAALVLPGLAAAKGPDGASLTGPGLSQPITFSGDGEMGQGTPFGTLVFAGGFFPQMYGQSPDPRLKSRPKVTLGPRYTIVYTVPAGENVRSQVTQDVYPYAKPVPVTYMRPGQTFWGTQHTKGGWIRASAALKDALVQAGLPADPPLSSAGFWSAGAIGAFAGLFGVLAIGGAAILMRRTN